jgi:3-dehydroquinate synthase
VHHQNHITTVSLPASPARSYPIAIREGLLAEAASSIARTAGPGAVFLVTDTTVGRLYGRQLHSACARVVSRCALLDFPPGEGSKRLRVYNALTRRLLGLGAKRDSLIVALGGGVVGDLAGFVAATLLRGVALLQIPTTLLAQLDSSVGGKVGIDHALGKNMLGAFHQPCSVLIDPLVLRSLPVREFRNGLAELVKIALALDGALFRRIEQAAPRITRTAGPLLRELISKAVSLKAAVVMKDEFESGLRKTLNLGHTVGHALEAASGYRIRHGEAVSIGLAVEARIAVRMGLLEEPALERILAVLRALGLPRDVPSGINRRSFVRSLSLDKKFTGGGTAYALPAGIGRSAIGVPVPGSVLDEAMES